MKNAAATATAMRTFTDAERGLIQSYAHEVWEYVAGDILAAVAEEKGKNINKVTVTRAEVIELVLDADRLSDRIDRAIGAGRAPADLLKRFNALSFDAMEAVVAPAFKHARYGM